MRQAEAEVSSLSSPPPPPPLLQGEPCDDGEKKKSRKGTNHAKTLIVRVGRT